MAIYDRTGRVLYGPVPTNNVLRGAGGACAARNNGDAVVRYDQLAGRWLIVMPIFTRQPLREGGEPPTPRGGEPARLSMPGRPDQPGRLSPTIPAPPCGPTATMCRPAPTGSAAFSCISRAPARPTACSAGWPARPSDRRGNIGIGYSFGGVPHFAGHLFAARLSSDPRGVLSLREAVLVEGEAAQTNTLRWEDYTQTAIDPADDCTIWYVGDSLRQGATSYSSKIGAFRIAGCP